MRFLIEGRLWPSCGLTAAEYVDLAVREREMVLGWLASGVALAYGRPVSVPGGTRSRCPLAPYAGVTVRRSDVARAPGGTRARSPVAAG